MKKSEMLNSLDSHFKESIGTGGATTVLQSTLTIPARYLGVAKAKDAAQIDLTRIIPDPSQPRKTFDEAGLSSLADSLRIRGQLQPIRVRWDEPLERFVILCGERRWRAAQLAEMTSIDAVVHGEPLTDAERLSIQLVENAQRVDLKPVEQASAYQTLMEANGWGVRELARELSISHASVSRSLALLNLPDSVQLQVDEGKISAAVGYEVAKMPETQREEAANLAIEQRLTREEIKGAGRFSKSRGPVSSRIEPKVIDWGSGVSVTIRWKPGTTATSALAALRRAIKQIQDEERSESAA